MRFYGFVVNKDKTATLNLMEDVGKGNGVIGSRWGATFVKSGKATEISDECERLNVELANTGKYKD